jgi:hypothetical protein
MDPNSSHQLWSRWSFVIIDGGRHPPFHEVEINAARWLTKLFGTVGRARVKELPHSWEIVCEAEGPPATDPVCIADVRRQFQNNFVAQGWGPLSVGVVEVDILAGDREDGGPAVQIVVMPTVLGKQAVG